MTAKYWMRVNVALAACAGLALRFFFVLKLPATDSGDAPFYIELAWNWLKSGVYGATVDGRLVPLDTRGPGYPAFLAAVFSLAGKSSRAVMLTQAIVDLATCFVVALIAARLAPVLSRRRVAIAGLWLAALCPFTANYTAVVLTETLVTFLTALAILLLVQAEASDAGAVQAAGKGALSPWFLGGVVCGFGALARPETPLLLIAMGLALVAKWWRPTDWMKLARTGVLVGVGLVLPLLPWAARNWHMLHEVQFLAPRYVESEDEFAPRGFNAWTGTWLWRFRDVYLTLWKLDSEEISLERIPAEAFDSAQEYSRVAAILDTYDDTLTLSREQDAEFHEIARERTAHRPLRTYLKIPLLRSLAMWFTPRTEMLPNSSPLWPAALEWENDRFDFLVTLGLVLVNAACVILALAGAWIARGRPGWALLILFIVLRTLFIASFIETPEPRYVLECFPAVLPLAAQCFTGRRQLSSTGSG